MEIVMGMFDYVQCDIPLPDGWEPRALLQTKDFDCEMVTHLITKEGRLMLERIDETHIVPKEDRPYPKEDGLLGMCGMLRTVRSRHDSNFHGIVHFGGLETIGYEPDERYGERGRPMYRGHDYSAKFTNGQIVEITVSEDDL